MAERKFQLQMPSDSNSEIFFNSKNLTIDFRKNLKTKKTNAPKMLRVVVQAYGQIIEDRFFKPNSTITFGTGSNFIIPIPIPNLPNGHPLITYNSPGNVSLRISTQLSGILQMGEKVVTISEIKKSGLDETLIEMSDNPRGAVEEGTLRIYFEEIDTPEKIPAVPFIQSLADREFSKWFIMSLAMHLMLLLLIKLIPRPPHVEKKLEDLSASFQKILIQPQEIKIYKPVIATNPLTEKEANTNPNFNNQKNPKGGRQGEGAKSAGPEGKKGKTTDIVSKPSLAKVKDAGVLSFFSQGGKSGGFNDLVDDSVKKLADDISKPTTRFGLESETETRQSKGIVNNATGGGGKTASIGSGLSTKGHGGNQKGDGLSDLGTGKARTNVVAKIDADSATVTGALSKEQIQKVISAYMGQVEYCYERELQKEPNLRGKILVNFVIGLTGAVTSASVTNSTMGNATVESCITNVFRRMPFPSPGSGIVEAAYPLVFNVAG